MNSFRWERTASGNNLIYIDGAGHIYVTISSRTKRVWIWMDSLNLDFEDATDAIEYDVDNIAIAKKEIEEVFNA